MKLDLDFDCGDNSCLFAKKRGGMRTNGGCRCTRNPGFSSRFKKILDHCEKLEEVVEAAKGLFNLCENDLGMDKPELTALRCALKKLKE